MKPSEIGIPREVAREMYLFFLRTTAPRIAAEIKEEARKEASPHGSK